MSALHEWAFVLTDPAGVAQQDIRAAASLQFTRNAAAAISFQFDVESEEADRINTMLSVGLPRLRAYRDGTLRFNGVWQPMREQAQEDAGTLQASFADPFATLAERFTAAMRRFTAIDGAQIARTLITETNSESATGLRLGVSPAAATRTRAFVHQQVADAIVGLAGEQGGFDFEIVPVDEGAVCGVFNTYAKLGSDRTGAGCTFEFGPGTLGNVLSVGRTTQPPINKVRVLGASGKAQEASDAASIAAYGLHMVVESAANSVKGNDALAARAAELLRPQPVRVVEFEPDPASAPTPWDDYWLGDYVSARARLGSLQLDQPVRVNGVGVSVDDSGVEAAHSLSFDDQAD